MLSTLVSYELYTCRVQCTTVYISLSEYNHARGGEASCRRFTDGTNTGEDETLLFTLKPLPLFIYSRYGPVIFANLTADITEVMLT